MNIKFSDYLPQNLRTFKIKALYGGTYGANIEYFYGYFNNNHLLGMHYKYTKDTEFERDDDEKDGIGSMDTIVKHSLYIGEFVNDLKMGLCIEVNPYRTHEILSCKIFNQDKEISLDYIKENAINIINIDEKTIIYKWHYCSLIYKNNTLTYVGNLDENNNPYGAGTYLLDNGETNEYGIYLNNENILDSFIYENWEAIKVDEIEKEGFTVYKEMDFYNNGNTYLKIYEGPVSNGLFNGFGYFNIKSYKNGYSYYKTQLGVFKDNEFYFGYFYRCENPGAKTKKFFGYFDQRPFDQYGETIIYNNKKYIGEHKNGIPHGIGVLYLDEQNIIVGTFENGLLHGIGATFKFLDNEWTPYDYIKYRRDYYYDFSSLSIYINGEIKTDYTFKNFYDK